MALDVKRSETGFSKAPQTERTKTRIKAACVMKKAWNLPFARRLAEKKAARTMSPAIA